ncbi:MAG: TetR/AcrR family transcriptional regulator [Ardenticatenaceae bacterium]
MKRIRNPKEKRKKIIEAAKRILRDGGYFTNFSLAKVAKEAGVSKGGLLHHFPSKEALLHGVAQDIISRFESGLAEKREEQAERDQPGSFTRAYVEFVLGDGQEPLSDVSPVLLAFLRSNENEASIKSRFAYWQQQTEQDGLDIATATLIRLAIDGLIYTEVIDDTPISHDLRQQMRERLLQLIDQAI